MKKLKSNFVDISSSQVKVLAVNIVIAFGVPTKLQRCATMKFFLYNKAQRNFWQVKVVRVSVRE